MYSAPSYARRDRSCPLPLSGGGTRPQPRGEGSSARPKRADGRVSIPITVAKPDIPFTPHPHRRPNPEPAVNTHLPLRFPHPFRHDHPPVRDVNELEIAGLTVGARTAQRVPAIMG